VVYLYLVAGSPLPREKIFRWRRNSFINMAEMFLSVYFNVYVP
jgi:hypothetical protein